jgi:glutamyl-Q tRNA(Asp) synthetase
MSANWRIMLQECRTACRMQAAFRFAPSPNGPLHLGHAYSALLNERLARDLGGRLLLRIEDIDLARTREAYVAGILDDLAWLRIAWERPIRRQSAHFDVYAEAARRLRSAGLIYPCFCSRGAILAEAAARGAGWPRDPDGGPLYPGTCRAIAPEERARRLAAGEPHAWRLDMAAALAAAPGPHGYRRFEAEAEEAAMAADPPRWGDAVIVRKDVPASYHLAVVVDDAVQAVTHVVRGRDLEAATDLHVLLQALLGLPTPRYHHHRLVEDEGGLKLAKSRGSPSLAALRGEGTSPDEVRRMLGF